MRLIIIVVAFVVSLLVAFAVSGVFGEDEQVAQPVVLQQAPAPVEPKIEKVNIVVSLRDMSIGTVIQRSDYDIKPWPQHLLPPGAVVYDQANPPQIDGMITSTPIVKDEPLLMAKLRNPNDPSFLSGQLGEGMRALTISVDMVNSVSGFVSPGDKVDVLFTFELKSGNIQGSDITVTKGDGEGKSGEVSFSEILMPNVKVLAVDRKVISGNASAEENQNPIPSTVTLEVNQRGAQKLRLAEKMGKLSLALRSVKDKDNFDRVRPTAEQDLTRILPPAYFPALFDSDAAYDFSVVDLYGNTLSEASDQTKNATQDKSNPYTSINVYRGVTLEKVEVKK